MAPQSSKRGGFNGMYLTLTLTFVTGVVLGLIIGLTIRARALTSTMTSSLNQRDCLVDDTWPNSNASDSALMLVGVLTTRDFLQTRALAAHRTWAPSIDGDVMYLTSEGSKPPPGGADMKVVALTGVDDVYPPMKKAFLSLRYFYDNFIDQYEWFARADDDVYIRGVELAAMLRSVDSNKAQYIGQPGQGRPEDIGRMAMSHTDNFCMGGSVYIMSRQTLRLIGPHISTCLKELYSVHDDVEIGRCVRHHAGIPCTWAYEMEHLFHHLYVSTAVPLDAPEIAEALTLHPLKNVSQLYRVHVHFASRTIGKLRHNLTTLRQTVRQLATGSNAMWRERTIGDVIHWQPIVDNSIYSASSDQPMRALESHSADALNKIVQDTINNMNGRRDKRMVLQKLTNSYRRIVPCEHVDYIIDTTLLNVNKKTKAREHTRHTFDSLEFREVTYDNMIHKDDKLSMPRQMLLWLLAVLSGEYPTTTVHIIAQCTHLSSVDQFMRNMAAVVLATEERVTITIVGAFNQSQSSSIRVLLDKYQADYAQHDFYLKPSNLGCITYSHLRAVGKHKGLVLVLPADVRLSRDTLQRIRMRVVEGSQVYYPIVFAEYYNGDIQVNTSSSKADIGYWQYNQYDVIAAATSDIGQLTGQSQSSDCINYNLMLDRVVTSGHLTITQAADPGMVRVYNPDTCAQLRSRSTSELETEELNYCVNSYASTSTLTDLIRQLKLGVESL